MKNDKGFVYLPQSDGKRLRIPFEDATESVTLKCTEKDIKDAVCGDPTNCVMARMFRRAFGPMCTEVRVGKTSMHVVMGKGTRMHSLRFDVKGKLAKAVHQFDSSKGGSGFTAGEDYSLHPPTPSDRRGARPGRPWNREGGKGVQKQLTERKAPIRPTRSLFCFIQPRPL